MPDWQAGLDAMDEQPSLPSLGTGNERIDIIIIACIKHCFEASSVFLLSGIQYTAWLSLQSVRIASE